MICSTWKIQTILYKTWQVERATRICGVSLDLKELYKFFFFGESFNLWRPLLMMALYHQIKAPISFWCRRRLNPRSLIQPSETLPVELIRTHYKKFNYISRLIEELGPWFSGRIGQSIPTNIGLEAYYHSYWI